MNAVIEKKPNPTRSKQQGTISSRVSIFWDYLDESPADVVSKVPCPEVGTVLSAAGRTFSEPGIERVSGRFGDDSRDGSWVMKEEEIWAMRITNIEWGVDACKERWGCVFPGTT